MNTASPQGMNFLEAARLARESKGGEPLTFICGLSGTADPLLLYLTAACATRGREARVRTLPFNTLTQALLSEPEAGTSEVFLVLPWDLASEADWRSGIATAPPEEEALRQRAAATIDRLARRRARLLYLPAPIAPFWLHPARMSAFALWLESEMCRVGAVRLPADAFALRSYLATGCPIGGASLGLIAERIVDQALRPHVESARVLVTDLDNTMWSGIIGDDGPDGIHFLPEGRGYPHFLYQSALKRLQADGVLLAAVSKNQPDAVLPPFRDGRMILQEDHFIAIVASWNAKSAQIRELATRLNLGLESFVFVDDNPVELAEVALALPAVRCVRFPPSATEMPALIDELSVCFVRRDVTEEDRQRTELYRRRLSGMAPSEMDGADLSQFLRELEMTLTLRDRSIGDRVRVVQLINKTNQFNLNGRRVTDDQVETVLAAGGRLYGATLADRTGSHGEILACLVRADGEVASLVMSCRVFQRRVEYAFLGWLANRVPLPTTLSYASTQKNDPLREFLRDIFGSMPDDGCIPLDATTLSSRCAEVMALFRIIDQTGV